MGFMFALTIAAQHAAAGRTMFAEAITTFVGRFAGL